MFIAHKIMPTQHLDIIFQRCPSKAFKSKSKDRLWESSQIRTEKNMQQRNQYQHNALVSKAKKNHLAEIAPIYIEK